MASRILVWFLIAPAILTVALQVEGQDSLLNSTLNFRDVTSTAVNQTFPEQSLNEKKIEFADFDNDGDLDVAISNCSGDFGQRRNKLYRNDHGQLQEVSGAPVIPEFEIDDMSRACLFRDFDNDGLADIIVVCDSNSGTNGNSAPGRTKFLRNIDGQFFVNETERLDDLMGAAGDGVAADFDQNGLLDVALTNHPFLSRDTLALNGINGLSAGEFAEITNPNMPVEADYGAQIDAADMNGDGLIDLLVANLFDDEVIYFNNNANMGTGPGDFRYGGVGNQLVFDLPDTNSTVDQSLIAADFNNDGLMDLFHSNVGPADLGNMPRFDRVRQNQGNNEFVIPEFKTIPLVEEIESVTTRAVAVDLDRDFRQDLIVMSRDRRPYIFRNTSENGDISFLAWTPEEFGNQQFGWGVGAAHLLGDERCDILIGATQDEFLFESIPSPSFAAKDLENGLLPPLLDLEPIQIVGEVGFDGVQFDAGELPSGARVSVLLRSWGDMNLKALADGSNIAASDRPGHSTDQTLQFVHSGGNLMIEVGMDQLSFDGNHDGSTDLLDIQWFVLCVLGEFVDCEPFDSEDRGFIGLIDVPRFVDRLTASAQEEFYSLEILVRSD